MLAEVRRLWDHARWADDSLLAAFAQNEGEPPEAWREFAHVIGTAETWLARIQGRASTLSIWPASREVPSAVGAVHAGYAALLGQLDEAGLLRTFSYLNSAGQGFSNTVQDVLLHAALHGQYHRGKVNLLLRQAGLSPVPTDYIAFIRGAPAAVTPPR
jgi:uncharacterized damage-inducible protein DinB